jgi:hypothetical protein
MRLADAAIEAAAAALFAWVALSVTLSLIRSRNFSWLAVSLIGVFAVSAPHRALHAVRLSVGHSDASWDSAAVDAAVLIFLALYVALRSRVHQLAGERFVLVADQLGYERLHAEIAELRAQVDACLQSERNIRGDLDLERARVETFTAQLRTVVPIACDLAEHASDVSRGQEPDYERLRRDATGLLPSLAEFAKSLGLE